MCEWVNLTSALKCFWAVGVKISVSTWASLFYRSWSASVTTCDCCGLIWPGKWMPATPLPTENRSHMSAGVGVLFFCPAWKGYVVKRVLRKAQGGTAGHMEQRAQTTHPSAQAALPVWLNYVHQQACTPEAWDNRRARLDGVGKGYTLLPFTITLHCRFVSEWKHRHGISSAFPWRQSCESVPAGLWMF